jgi:hypothetical protein
MRKAVTLIGCVVALALAGTAVAGSTGAEVVRDAGCVTTPFATVCTTVKSVTNSTTTPSGNVSYVTSGMVARTMTFVFGGTMTTSSNFHLHALAKQGEIATASDHYEEQSEYVSGAYRVSCSSSYDIQVANGETKVLRSELECTVQ